MFPLVPAYPGCPGSKAVKRSLFSALTLLVGWQEGHLACKKTEQWGAGMVICLERGADLHMAQLMPLPITSVKSRFVLPFSYCLTGVVPEKGLLNQCVCVCCHQYSCSEMSTHGHDLATGVFHLCL